MTKQKGEKMPFTISEAIKRLTDILQERGDLPIYFLYDGFVYDGVYQVVVEEPIESDYRGDSLPLRVVVTDPDRQRND